MPPPIRVIGARAATAVGTRIYQAGAVVLATGGITYPLTGSTGDGYAWAAAMGHQIVEPRPVLVPLLTNAPWVSGLAGLTLKNVAVSLWAGGGLADAPTDPAQEEAVAGVLAEETPPPAVGAPTAGALTGAPVAETPARCLASFQGEMLFAHFGLTGPIILSLSRYYRRDLPLPVEARLDLKPALSPEVLDQRLRGDFDIYREKQLKNGMGDLLPRSLIPAVIQAAGLSGEQPLAELTRRQRLRLGQVLKALPMEIIGTRPPAEGIITAGGVALPEINAKTMASLKAAGLYLAGEMLDIDGFTGGYNLQAAFSTGWVAGESAAVFAAGDL
ncbi:MAG: NAD(P)/FAD-dependent oxidoreductase [Peptococcaceae bacterium]|nr:NAD(P)/FAD-dependent oxidoreductase [Peptococcaceae bacterium]